MSALLSEDELKQWSGFGQRQKLEAWLRENKIAYTYGKGNKVITTQRAIDKALHGEEAANETKDAFF